MAFGKSLPHFAAGLVVKGFGRGSKELGIPTANFEPKVVKALPEDLNTGVYFGWAQVDEGEVHKMVMSIGWNPYYKNTEKSMETHIMHTFTEDFYGQQLKVCILGFIRPEKDFSSLDDLVKAINSDINEASSQLDTLQFSSFKVHSFFTV